MYFKGTFIHTSKHLLLKDIHKHAFTQTFDVLWHSPILIQLLFMDIYPALIPVLIFLEHLSSCYTSTYFSWTFPQPFYQHLFVWDIYPTLIPALTFLGHLPSSHTSTHFSGTFTQLSYQHLVSGTFTQLSYQHLPFWDIDPALTLALTLFWDAYPNLIQVLSVLGHSHTYIHPSTYKYPTDFQDSVVVVYISLFGAW